MKKIIFQNEHRQKHFEFFKSMNHPHFNICANVDITKFIAILKQNDLPFTYSIVYAIARTAKQVKEFRWRIIEDELYECESVTPSFTTYTEVADVFSFCDVDYEENYFEFIKKAAAKADLMSKQPSFEDSNKQDYLFLSSIPWVSFTSLQHAMPYHPTDSMPRMTWGKYFEENGKIKMPLSVQAHHALVDGRHVGQYFKEFELLLNDFDEVLKAAGNK